MDLLSHLALGLSTATTPTNILYAFFGCVLGTVIGVLPGLGPLLTIAMLLPFTFGLDPTAALIMLAGIYYGSQYGGSTTAILMSLPGETSSVVTVIDGHQMARQGRAGVAIATAAIGSFFAGTVATLLLAAFVAPLTKMAIGFGPAEYFALMALGLVAAVSLASGSQLKALGMVVIGLLLGLVGTDVNSGVTRFTFGARFLWDGIDFVVVAMGIFAFGEVIASAGERARPTVPARIRELWPNREDFRRMTPPILRGTAIGSLVGALPGAGLALGSFFAYSLEKRISRRPEEFGQGAIEGVAAPEAANNAAAQTAFVPTLALGIPGSATMALMLGAMTLHNVQPGPMVVQTNPELFWGLIASMWIGNLMLLILNLPLVGIWVQLLRIPYSLLYPLILVFSCIGIYSLRNSMEDVFLAAAFGAAGYLFRLLRCEPAPLLLGLVLGPMLEENFRRALLLSRGDYMTFLVSPVSCVLLLATFALVASFAWAAFSRRGRRLRE